MTTELVIYGAGGFGREVADLANDCNAGIIQYKVVAFVDDDPTMQGNNLDGIPVLNLEEAYIRHSQGLMVVAVGSSKARASLVTKAAFMGFGFDTLVHPNVIVSKWADLGKGVVVCAGSIITANAIIGAFAQINMDCTIAHDVHVGQYTTLAMGVHIGGYVNVGRYVFIGNGAVIVNGTKDNPIVIPDNTVIGAGACVTKSILRAGTYVGVPALETKQSIHRRSSTTLKQQGTE